MQCLAEDELVELAHAGALADAPTLEEHLAECATCAAVVAELAHAGSGGVDDLAGRRLGRYRLDQRLGAGAMGTVFRGWDEELRRAVAVKVLALADPDGAWSRRLLVEARAAAAIAHPNVVAVHDVGVVDGVTFVVSELVVGESLRAAMAAGAVPPARARALGIALARGLAAAHAAGVVHRDLKPENVVIGAGGEPKILDFGLAKRADDASPLDATEPGAVLGTIGYMAPEQARGDGVDARADVFACGAILFELATGRRAFDGATAADRLGALLRDDPVASARAALGGLAPVVARCLEKEPARRFQSAADLAWTLERLAPSAPGRRPTRRALLLGAAAAAGVGALGWALGRRGRGRGAARATPALHPLTFRHGRVWSARAAGDGASVYFGAAWDDEPLRAYGLRLAGGVVRALELPSADVLAVSSTALAIALERRHVDGQCATGRLALAPIDGGQPRLLADDVQQADFFPDGQTLAIVTRAGRGMRLEAPLGRTVLEVPGWISDVRVAPRGDRVACMLHPDRNDDQGEVAVVELATGAVRTITAGWSSLAGLAWSPRGDRLWFTGGRADAVSAVWSATLDGRVREEYATLGRLRLHDLIDERRLLVSRDVWRLRTRVAGAGRAPRDCSLTEFALAAGLSSDGATLAVSEFGDVDEVNGVYAVPTDGGARLRLGPGAAWALSPDGALVFATGFARVDDGPPQGVVYTTAGGEPRAIALAPIARVRAAAWRGDAELVVVGAEVGRAPRLWRVAIAGPAPTPITAEGEHGVVAVAPTGAIAFVDADDQLRVIDPVGAPLAPPRAGYRDQVVCGWAGAAVQVRTTTAPVELAQVDVATGARTPSWTLTPPALGLRAVDAVAVAADGSYAYSHGQELSELFEIALPG
ncbi:MAG: serine/threonine-protein kinase [Myxococcales bacterium]|nr:serine/threonine-protein kinase [Myxococcales bacterium]